MLVGDVRDAEGGAALYGANVTVNDSIGSICDERGQFRIAIATGTHSLRVSMVGFEQLNRQVTVLPGDNDTLRLLLHPTVIQMTETLVSGDAPKSPHFTEVGEAAGLRFRHSHGSERIGNILQATGSGACFLDVDADGRQDVYFVSGESNRLYLGNGAGGFLDLTDTYGVGHAGFGMGCSAADYDGDGDTDLFLSNFGENVLYRNERDRSSFADVTESAGLSDRRWSVGSGWLDVDRDGDLDLFVGNYLDFSPHAPPIRSMASLHEGFRAYPGPRDFPGVADALYINHGDGTFSNVADSIGLNPHVGKAMGCAFGDYDGDGDTDIFVANDRTPNHLYRNDDGYLVDIALSAGVAFDEAGQASGAMGADFADYDLDGRLDLFVSNFSFEYNSLYRNQGGDSFWDVTGPAGLAAPSYRYVGWGSLFFDYDNDGDSDLFVANGDVHEDMDLLHQGVTFAQPDQLFRNEGNGSFVDISDSSGVQSAGANVGRGAAAADYDDDGDLDLLVVNLRDRPYLWRNDGGNAEHWLSFRLQNAQGSPAFGARITVYSGPRVILRESQTANSYLSQGDSRLFFGLSGRRRVDITIRWPDGSLESLSNLPVDQHLTLTQNQQTDAISPGTSP